jgi:hypothetical protein
LKEEKMKKIFAILLALVFVFALAGCAPAAPAKLLFVDGFANKTNVLSITRGSSQITVLPDKLGDGYFISPDGNQAIFVDQTGPADNMTANLHVINASQPMKETVIPIPHDILYSIGDPADVRISFWGGKTYLEIRHFDFQTTITNFVVYTIANGNFVKVGQTHLDKPYAIYADNAGLPITEKVVLVDQDNPPHDWLYDFATGDITPLFQLGNYLGFPHFSPDGKSYVYDTYFGEASGKVCFELGRIEKEPTELICKPFDLNTETGITANNAIVAWSPNGKYVAVSFDQGHAAAAWLYLIDVSSNTPKIVKQALLPGSVDDGRWSPDSTLLGFSTFSLDPNAHPVGGIYTIGPNAPLSLEYSDPKWESYVSDPSGETGGIFLVWFMGWTK